MHLLLSSSPNWYLSHVVAATADGTVAAYAGHLSVTVLCCRQQQIQRCLWPQRVRVSCITFAAADSLLVAGYEDGSARCFNWQTGECVCSRAAPKSKRKQSNSELTAVVAPAWLGDAVVFADAGGRLLLWPFDATAGERTTTKYTVLVESCGSKVVCLAAAPTPDNNTARSLHQVVAGCQDGSCVLVDVSAGCQLTKWRAHTAAVQCVVWWQHGPGDSQQQQPQHQQPQDHAAGASSSMSHSSHPAGFVVSAGGDRQLKLWMVPPHHHPQTTESSQAPTAAAAAPPQHNNNNATTSDMEAAAADAGGSSAAPAEAAAGAPSAVTGAGDSQVQAASATAPSSPAGSAAAAAAAAAASQPPAVLQLQPLSVAAVDPSLPAGRKAQFYGAAAVVPGSGRADGRIRVVCAGVNGRVGAVLLVPGQLDCRWSLLSKSPHTGGIFQLLLVSTPPPGTDPNTTTTSTTTTTSSSSSLLQPDKDQQQQQEPPDSQLQQQPVAVKDQADHRAVGHALVMMSVSMDRCFALSQLTLQAEGGGQQQCRPGWMCQGLGGFTYSCTVQRTFADAAEPYPQYSRVRVAVGCGDRTIRVLTLGVRQGLVVPASKPPPNQDQQQQQQQQHDQQQQQVAPDGGQSVVMSELQLPVPNTPLLLWKDITDRPQALAWHPTNHRLLAFGCYDGSLGVYDVASARVTVYSKRHGGPVTHLAWCKQQPQQQKQHGEQMQMSLLSVGGEGCLLCWPPVTPGSNSSSSTSARPVDLGAQLQALMTATTATAAAAAAGRSAGHEAAVMAKPGSDGVLLWSCMAITACGRWLAACSTRGHVLILSSRRASSSGGGGGRMAAGASSSSSSSREATPGRADSDSWRSRQAAGGGVLGPWQLEACSVTPPAMPLKAAAWRPQPTGHNPASAHSAGFSSSSASAGCAGAGAAGAVLAVVDEHHLHVFGSSSSSSNNSNSSSLLAGSLCCVPEAQQQQQQQQQLLTVAWAAADTVCVGCTDGSIHVIQVDVTATAATSAPKRVLLRPLHNIRGHSGPVLCVSGLPDWPGLLLSGSQDQTLRSWQPFVEATAAAAAAAAAAACVELPTAISSTAGQLQHDPEQVVNGGSSAAASTTAIATASAMEAGVQAVPAAAAGHATPDPTQQQQHVVGGEQMSQAGAATAAASAAIAGVKPTKKAASSRLFICPKAKTFLPDLPDTSNLVVQQQALLDVVALAEALYPAPVEALNPAAAVQSCNGLNLEVLALLGLGSTVAAAAAAGGDGGGGGGSSSTSSQQEQHQQQQQQQQHVAANMEPGGDPNQAGRSGVALSGAEAEAEVKACVSVAAAFHQHLSELVGREYSVGSWLPNMTADVPELLQQHQQLTQQRQQEQQQLEPHQQQQQQSRAGRRSRDSSSAGLLGLSDARLGMLQWLSGDIRGFLQGAIAADCVETPDVVALSAAGGVPAFNAAARLAAAKLTAAGEFEAAAVHLLAAGDVAAAATAAAAARR